MVFYMIDFDKIKAGPILCQCSVCHTKQPASVMSNPETFICFKCLYKEHGEAALKMAII